MINAHPKQSILLFKNSIGVPHGEIRGRMKHCLVNLRVQPSTLLNWPEPFDKEELKWDLCAVISKYQKKFPVLDEFQEDH